MEVKEGVHGIRKILNSMNSELEPVGASVELRRCTGDGQMVNK